MARETVANMKRQGDHEKAGEGGPGMRGASCMALLIASSLPPELPYGGVVPQQLMRSLRANRPTTALDMHSITQLGKKCEQLLLTSVSSMPLRQCDKKKTAWRLLIIYQREYKYVDQNKHKHEHTQANRNSKTNPRIGVASNHNKQEPNL